MNAREYYDDLLALTSASPLVASIDLQFREIWDNAPHHPEIETHPYHRHDASDDIHESSAMTPKLLPEALLGFTEA